MDEADEVAPFGAMLHGSQGTLPVGTPHLVEDGLEPGAVFVDCPQLDDATRECGGNFAQQRAQSRLKSGLRSGICLDMTGGVA
jgi:hypothetical protein